MKIQISNDRPKGKTPKGDGNLSPKTKNLPKNMPVTTNNKVKRPKVKKS
jgi:hypothetical protein